MTDDYFNSETKKHTEDAYRSIEKALKSHVVSAPWDPMPDLLCEAARAIGRCIKVQHGENEDSLKPVSNFIGTSS